MASPEFTPTRPIHSAQKLRLIGFLMHRFGLMYAKDLPPPAPKIRSAEDLLPDPTDDDE